jgi:pilus assembly protein Flp/PilA
MSDIRTPPRIGCSREELMLAPFKALWNDESGQDLVEYALLVALIAIIVIAALRLLGPTIANVFNNIESELSTV